MAIFLSSFPTSNGFAKVLTGLDLDPSATSALKRAGGDMNQAQALLFQEKMMELQTEEPDLFAALVEKQKQQRQSGQELEGEVHEKLVELSWDVVGSFISSESGQGLDEGIDVKCKAVAAACVSEENNQMISCGVLDVGCGDGAFLPYLTAKGADEGRYVGLDLSSTMIDKAKAKLKVAKAKQRKKQARKPQKTVSGSTGKKAGSPSFLQGNFLTHSRCKAPNSFDTVLFNGVIQFFSESMRGKIFEQARSLLKPGGRIVISHVQGGDFVQEERNGNAAMCLSIMPSVQDLIAEAKAVGGLQVLPVEEASLGSFYLVVLEAI